MRLLIDPIRGIPKRISTLALPTVKVIGIGFMIFSQSDFWLLEARSKKGKKKEREMLLCLISTDNEQQERMGMRERKYDKQRNSHLRGKSDDIQLLMQDSWLSNAVEGSDPLSFACCKDYLPFQCSWYVSWSAPAPEQESDGELAIVMHFTHSIAKGVFIDNLLDLFIHLCWWN